MLWRALKHVTQGFYIDVGAWSPVIDSVTFAFSERGWSGINVEPNPEFHSQLQTMRPRDINLRVALSDFAGSMPMNFLDSSGLSTLDDVIAGQHQMTGLIAVREEVQVITLSNLWQQYLAPGADVHFLKIDVEGLEEAVLKGNDWDANRPWIIVLEATLPMTQIASYEVWEPILHKANYHFVYADGLNRFYLAAEHQHLAQAFQLPPNVFDDFMLHAQWQAEVRAAAAAAAAAEAVAKSAEFEGKAVRAEAQLAQSLMQLQAVYESASWRITLPLRRLRSCLNKLK